MATEGGRADSPLVKSLFDEPYRFDFFQAVRLLERSDPRRQPVGRDGHPSREAVRFRTPVTLEFPASQINELSNGGADSRPPEMVVSFMGLTGPLGVLPHHYTELLAERILQKDTALWEFLDLFNHRLISLFFRAWERGRFPVWYERGGGTDRFTAYLFSLVGMGAEKLRGRLSLPDENLLGYCGLISQRPHSASAIEAALGDYFGVTARLEQFSGQWFTLDEDCVTRLGTANSRLGVDTIAGGRVWDNQSKFRVKLGPLRLEQFTALLPVGSAFEPAADLTRFLAGLEFDFDIQLILAAEEVPDCVLAARDGARPMLGWNTWLKTRPFTQDDSQVVLNTQSPAAH